MPEAPQDPRQHHPPSGEVNSSRLASDTPPPLSLTASEPSPDLGPDPKAAEASLVARCLEGHARAWDQLFAQHYGPAAAFVFQLSPDFSREDVEEVCQETFLTVVRRLSAFRGQSGLQTWIFRIATNQAHDFRTRRQALKRGGGVTPIPLHVHDDADAPPIDPPSPAPTPDHALMSAERQALVHQALDQIDPPCREILQLRYFGDLSYEELARTLELNPKTVSSRLSKCLDRLEVLLRPSCDPGICPLNSV